MLLGALVSDDLLASWTLVVAGGRLEGSTGFDDVSSLCCLLLKQRKDTHVYLGK